MKVMPGIQNVLKKISHQEIFKINRAIIFFKIAELDGNIDRNALTCTLNNTHDYKRKAINKAVNYFVKLGLVYERKGRKSIVICMTPKGKQFVQNMLKIINNETENGKYGYCKKCGKFDLLKEHHYLPRSMFGENPFVIHLCAEHHIEADALVLGKDLTKEECFKIIMDYISEE